MWGKYALNEYMRLPDTKEAEKNQTIWFCNKPEATGGQGGV